jgi:hypothetical protein
MSVVACGGGGDSPAGLPAASPAPTALEPTPTVPTPTVTVPSPTVPVATPTIPTPTPTAAVSTDPKLAAGFWSGRVDPQTTASAVFLPEGQAWTVLQATRTTVAGSATVSSTLTTLALGSVTVATPSVIVSGTAYTFSTTFSTETFRISGTVLPQGTLTVPATVAMATSPATPAYSWVYNRAFETAAKPADVAGSWNTSLSNGAIRLTLSISAAGALTGTSTSGCTYTGTVAPHPANIAVFNLSLNETCVPTPGASGLRTYAGIATLNETRTTLSAAYTTPDRTLAGVFAAVR